MWICEVCVSPCTIHLVRQVAFFVFLLCPHLPVSPSFLSNQMQILNLFQRCEKTQRKSYADMRLTSIHSAPLCSKSLAEGDMIIFSAYCVMSVDRTVLVFQST